jgi:hypothetical protein
MGHLGIEDKLCPFTLESTHFVFNKCPVYTHDGAFVKFSTNSHETDYSVCWRNFFISILGVSADFKADLLIV